jgi:hypothetical protein
MEFVEFAESFLGYSDPQPCRSMLYMPENEPAAPSAARPRGWSSLAGQECLAAGGSGAVLHAGPIPPPRQDVACLSPSGSSQDSLEGHLESESTGRRREAQSPSGRAKRAAALAVKRSGSGAAGKPRGEGPPC